MQPHVAAPNVLWTRVNKATRRGLLAKMNRMLPGAKRRVQSHVVAHNVLCQRCQSLNAERSTIPNGLNVLYFGVYNIIVNVNLPRDPTRILAN